MHKVMEQFTFHTISTGMTNITSTTKLMQAVFILLIMCLMLSGCSNADKYVEIILVDTAPAPICTPVSEGGSQSSADVSATPSPYSTSSPKPEKSDKQQASVKDKQTKASHAPSFDAIPTPTEIPADENVSLAWPDSSPSPIPTAPPSVTATPAPAALPTPTPAAAVPPIPKATPKLVSKNDEIPSKPQDIVPKSPMESVAVSVYSAIDGSALYQLQVAYDTYVSRYITAYAEFEKFCNPVIEFIKLMGEPTDDPDYIAELDRLKGMLYEYAEQFYQDVCVLDNEYFSEVKAILIKHGLQIG